MDLFKEKPLGRAEAPLKTEEDRRSQSRRNETLRDKIDHIIANPVPIASLDDSWRYDTLRGFDIDNPDMNISVRERVLLGPAIQEALEKKGVRDVTLVREENGMYGVYVKRVIERTRAAFQAD